MVVHAKVEETEGNFGGIEEGKKKKS